MGRIVAIDYGLKRTGLAVTDPEQIIASPLTAIPTSGLESFLSKYLGDEVVDKIIIGMPLSLDGSDTHITAEVRLLKEKIEKKYPKISVEFHDEQFTSKIAVREMVRGGMKKKERRKKENVDKISAVLILQSYLESEGL